MTEGGAEACGRVECGASQEGRREPIEAASQVCCVALVCWRSACRSRGRAGWGGAQRLRGSEKGKINPGAGGGGCCQPLFPEEGRLLGISGDCRVFQGVLELQVPEAACLSCFLRQCAAHTTCQVNPNSPSCLAPKVLGLFWSRGVRGQILVQKSWGNTWGQKSKLYLKVLGIYSSELRLGILVWSSGPPVPSMLSKTTETITTMPLSLGCLIPSTASRYLHFVSGDHIQGNLKKEYLNCF